MPSEILSISKEKTNKAPYKKSDSQIRSQIQFVFWQTSGIFVALSSDQLQKDSP